jgi:hypothetical protein
MQKNIILMGLVIVLTCSTHVQAQYAKTDSTYRRWFAGSTLFVLGNFATTNSPNFAQLNVGYRLTGKDVVSVEAITWKYAWPLGLNPIAHKEYGKQEEKFPGHIREFGLALVYQRYLWKGLYTSIHTMPTLQRFVDEDGNKVDNGFQLFNTIRVGYHVKLFKDRAFIEPSVGIAYRPYQTQMPDGFRQKDDQWPKHTVEPGLHFGVKF